MLSSILLSTLIAATTALPAGAPAQAPAGTLAFDVGLDSSGNTLYVPVVLSTNGTEGTYVLKGERPSVYTGTPAKLVETSINYPAPTELYFLIDNISAGAQVPEVGTGSTAAFAGPIVAVASSEGDSRWFKSNGFLDHVKLAPGQDFYACTSNVGVEQVDVLSWGVDGPNGELPDGCKKTKVIVRE